MNTFSKGNINFRKQAERFHAENPGNALQYEIDSELYQFINAALDFK